MKTMNSTIDASRTLSFQRWVWIYIICIIITISILTCSIAVGIMFFEMFNGKKKNTPSSLLLDSLIFSEMLNAISIAIPNYLFINRPFTWSNGLTSVSLFITNFMLICSFLHVLALTCDRFSAVRYPLRHRKLVTERLVTKSIVLIWLVSILLACLGLINRHYVMMTVAVTVIVVGTFVIVCYIYILLVLQETRVRRISNISWNAKLLSKARWQEKKSTMYYTLIIAAFVVCNFPLAFTVCIQQEKAGTTYITASSAAMISLTLLVANSLWNAVFYIMKRGCKRNRITDSRSIVIPMNTFQIQEYLTVL